jgi:hypothetical protein
MEWPDVRFEPIDSPRAESHIAAVWLRDNRRPVVREFLASALEGGGGDAEALGALEVASPRM